MDIHELRAVAQTIAKEAQKASSGLITIDSKSILNGKIDYESIKEVLDHLVEHDAIAYQANHLRALSKTLLQITPLPKFDLYAQRIEEAYFGRGNLDGESTQSTSNSEATLSSVSLTFNPDAGTVVLNDVFLLATPVFDSENHRLMEYLVAHPNQTVSLDAINQALSPPLSKPLSKVLENLNINGAIRKAFFKVSKNSICYTPQRTIDELKQANLFPLRLFGSG
jgi:hypothetical protein